MKKQIYDEKNGLNYTLHGDYYLPDLEINEKEPTYGKYGIMRKKFLKEHRSARYQYLVLTGKLTEHLNHHIVGGLIYEGNHDVLAIDGICAVVVFLCGRVGYLPYEVPSKHIGQFISQLFDVILIDIAYLGGAHEWQGVMCARNFAFL